jgi:transposase-like protein
MSKIPQGEWDAIAARYAQGESISRIAQSYGCTPPAIHYILKRNRQRGVHNQGPKLNGAPLSASGSISEPAERRDAFQRARSRSEDQLESATLNESRVAPTPPIELRPRRERQDPPGGPASERRDQPISQPRADSAGNPGQTSAMTASLDSDLQDRAEAAIEAFRASFDAALAERSPVCRQRLRQAASDLMRVAARTTIVLDRQNASTERTSFGAEDYARWRHPR